MKSQRLFLLCSTSKGSTCKCVMSVKEAWTGEMKTLHVTLYGQITTGQWKSCSANLFTYEYNYEPKHVCLFTIQSACLYQQKQSFVHYQKNNVGIGEKRRRILEKILVKVVFYIQCIFPFTLCEAMYHIPPTPLPVSWSFDTLTGVQRRPRGSCVPKMGR